MTPVPLLSRCLVLGALVLTGCADRTRGPERETGAYVVVFTVTRSADHAAIAATSLRATLGGETRVKTRAKTPTENEPVVRGFLARLNRTRQPGVYELVTRVSVREATRNKKGKRKVSERFIGALVPTRPGENQVVSTESDPIHVEARLERR